MPNLENLLKQIEGQRGVVTGLGEKTAGATTGFEYGEAIRERLKPDEELIKSIAAARSKMLAIPSEVRARQKPGWVTPSQTAGIISAEQEPLRTSWETQMQLREAKKGRTEDTIKRVTEMINKDIEKQESRYDQEREKLEDLITERDWVTSQQQFQEEMELKRAQEARLGRDKEDEGENKDAIVDAYVNQVKSEGIGLINVPAEYRGEVAVKLTQTTEETTWSKEIIQGLKEQGKSDDEILAAAKEDGMEEQVKGWLEELYEGGTGGQIGRTVLKSFKEAPSNIKWGLGQVKSWLTEDLGK